MPLLLIVWLLLIRRLGYEKLTLALTIVGFWIAAVYSIVTLPQRFPYPVDLALFVLVTVLSIAGLIYVLTKKEISMELRAHYQNLIQRMDQWSYLYDKYGDEMICLATKDEKFGTRRSGIPSKLENDKKHLEKFKVTYKLYLDGKKFSKEYKEQDAKTDRLFKTAIQKRIAEKGLVIDETEQIKLTWMLQMVIEGELKVFAIDGKLTLVQPIFAPDDTPPALHGIRDELKQRQDLRQSIYDRLVAKKEIETNEHEFLASLRNEVIERSKETDYSIPQLRNGVCADCEHLK